MHDHPRFTHYLNHAQRRLITRTNGLFVASDLADEFAAREVAGAMVYDQLADLRESIVAIEMQEMEHVAHKLQRVAQNASVGKTAFLVGDSRSFSLLQLLCNLTDLNYCAQVFDSPEEALDWLGWNAQAEVSPEIDNTPPVHRAKRKETTMTETMEAIDRLLAAGAALSSDIEPLIIRICEHADELEGSLLRMDGQSGDERVRVQLQKLLAQVELRKTCLESALQNLRAVQRQTPAADNCSTDSTHASTSSNLPEDNLK